jgi:hypothetical protein
VPEDPCAWVHKKKELYLQPFYLQNIQKGVTAAMDATVKKYQADLGGIVLRHKNCKLLSVDGSITDEESLIKLQVKADFEIFRPQEGCLLRGVVNKVSDNNVSCLVYEVFNISCPRGLHGEGDWIGDQANLGQELTCQVTKVDLMSRMPYIRGEITELHEYQGIEMNEGEASSNHIKWDDEEEANLELEPEVVVKKKKKSKTEELSQSDNAADSDSSSSKKKRKKRSVDLEDVKPDLEELDLKLKKKKKKHEKERELEDINEEEPQVPAKKKKKKSKSRDEDVPGVYIKQEVLSGTSDLELSPVKGSSSLKRKRRSEIADELPKKKKKRKTLTNSDGEEFYYDSDGCPVVVS